MSESDQSLNRRVEATGTAVAGPIAELTGSAAVEYQSLWQHFQTRSLTAERQYLSGEHHSLTITELFGLISFVAVALALVARFEIAGSLMVFLLASLISMLIGSLSTRGSRVRFWNQLLWGILVLIACVIGDPFVFGIYKAAIPESLHPRCVGPYFAFGYSILLIQLSWFVGARTAPWLNALLAGQMMGCALILHLISLALVPVGILGMLSLVGLVCLTPFIAGVVQFRTSRMHYQWSGLDGQRNRSIFLLGFLLVVAAFVLLSVIGKALFFGDI